MLKRVKVNAQHGSACWRLLLVLATVPSLIHAADRMIHEPGEFSIPEVFPLNDRQLSRLRHLVDTDAEAAAIVKGIETAVQQLQPVEPTPLRVIEYEGLVNNDPRRIKTVASLKQMGDVAVLLRHWQATGSSQSAGDLRRLTFAWAMTYEPDGNDVNENKLFPLLVGYQALRGGFADAQRRSVDSWVRRLGEMHAGSVSNSRHYTNRYSKHLRLLALAGLILDREDWQTTAREGVKRFVRESLRADGTSADLELRDSLGYHGSALRPPLQLAMLGGDAGRQLYVWQSAQGASLKRSVDYLVPYALGETVHPEWVDTKVNLDRQRAAAGIAKYQAGTPYDPRDALEVMELASYFDSSLLRVVQHITKSPRRQFPTWTTLVNAAVSRPNAPKIVETSDMKRALVEHGFDPDALSLPRSTDAFPREKLQQVRFTTIAKLDAFPEGPSYHPTLDRFFFSGQDALTRLDPGKTPHRILGRPGGGGTRHLPDGSVLIIGHVGLRRLHRDGRVELLADGHETGAGNDLTIGKEGEVFLSVPKAGIYRLTAGADGRLEKVAEKGCNGLAVDPSGQFLYVVRRGVQRYTLDPESDSLGDPETVYEFADGQAGGDGCTFDAWGNFYSMHFATGVIRVIEPSSRQLISTLSVGVAPASNLTFGGSNNCDLLVTAGAPKFGNCQILKASLGITGFCGHVGSREYKAIHELPERGRW